MIIANKTSAVGLLMNRVVQFLEDTETLCWTIWMLYIQYRHSHTF